VDQVFLNGISGIRRACIRDLCGFDEQIVDDTDTVTVIRLLDQMLVAQTETDLPSGRAAEMAAADRERLIAAVYKQTFGDRVKSTINCSQCNEPFDLDFEVSDLLTTLGEEQGKIETIRSKEGDFILENGCRFRLPSGIDEMAVFGLPLEEAQKILLSRCIIEGDPERNGKHVQDAMQKLAPVAEIDLDAPCPECGETQSVHFSLQSYLLAALRQERPRLIREVHRLATAYGWGLNEILSLPRSQRRSFVELIESDISLEGRL
jgi:hypothetical protein